jgi:hypothetical protein
MFFSLINKTYNKKIYFLIDLLIKNNIFVLKSEFKKSNNK